MLLNPHVGLIIWTIVTFAVVFLVLKATVWKPLLAALDAREQRISDALAGAEKARDQAQATLAEHQKRLEAAEAEASEIARNAREEAGKAHREIVEKARAEAQRSVEQARRSIEIDKQAALSALRVEVADLVVQAAGALVEANLDDEQNRKLVDDLIEGIPQGPAENN
jgi:F-type H+-transporting ATPase subunit b